MSDAPEQACCGTAHFWEYVPEPWEHIHIDHAGPVKGETYLVIVDSYSKWLEVERVKSTDARQHAKYCADCLRYTDCLGLWYQIMAQVSRVRISIHSCG